MVSKYSLSGSGYYSLSFLSKFIFREFVPPVSEIMGFCFDFKLLVGGFLRKPLPEFLEFFEDYDGGLFSIL